jgi:hypothetical protein
VLEELGQERLAELAAQAFALEQLAFALVRLALFQRSYHYPNGQHQHGQQLQTLK